MHIYIQVEESKFPHLKAKYAEHKSAFQGDSGLDVFLPEPEILKQQIYEFRGSHVHPGTTTFHVDFGIRCCAVKEKKHQMEDEQIVSFLMIPRSSTGKTNLRLANSVGLIDAAYTGCIQADLDWHHFHEVDIVPEKPVQLISPTLEPVTFELVTEETLPRLRMNRVRGERGFGSSGI